MKKLGERNYLLLEQGIKICGNFNPAEAMAWGMENFYLKEYEAVEAFMKWVNEDEANRAFGSRNYEARYQEFLDATGREGSRWREPKLELFGLYDLDTIKAVNRLLKPRGLRLKTKTNYRHWGDQIVVRLEETS